MFISVTLITTETLLSNVLNTQQINLKGFLTSKENISIYVENNMNNFSHEFISMLCQHNLIKFPLSQKPLIRKMICTIINKEQLKYTKG